jgi:hypothetical protein
VVSNTATVANTVAYSSFGPFAGEGSLYFGGGNSTSGYVQFPSSVTSLNFDITLQDITIEFWVYAVRTAQPGPFIFRGPTPGSATSEWQIYQDGSGMVFQAASTSTSPTTNKMTINQWNHVAATIQGSTITLWVNGTSIATATKSTSTYNSAYPVAIGAGNYNTYYNGYISNLRFVRGQALYTTTFVPPTAPLQPIQGTTQAGLPYGTVFLLRNTGAPGRVLTSKFGGANSGSVLSFPPAAVTTYATTLNSGYGQGVYVASASSENTSGFYAWQAFNKNPANSWSSTGNLYNSSTGVYAGAASNVTVDVTGTSYVGEWIQVQMPSSIILSNYQVQQRGDAGATTGEPKTWWVLGSRDGTNWSLVDQRSNITWNGAGSNNYMTVQSSQAFTFYRFVTYVIGASVGNQNVVIGEWTLNGTIEGPGVSPDGKLGVGVSAPVQALEVAGSAVVAGTLSAGNPLMFRNALYNGDMRINQRGISTNWASPTAMGTSGTGLNYSLDRMNHIRSALQSGGALAQGTLAATDAPFSQGLQYYLRIGRASGDTNTGLMEVAQLLESRESYKFAGQTITFSFFYRTGSGFSGSGVIGSILYGTGTDQNGVVSSLTNQGTLTSPTYSASNAWQRVSFTTFIPSTSSQVGMTIYYTPSGTAGGFDYFDVTGVQLEKGSVATPFEVVPYGTELALCQRYFQISGASMGGGIAYLNYAISSPVKFPVTMRATPVFTLSSNALRNSATGANSILTTPTLFITQHGYSILYEGAGAPGISPVLTVGNAYDYSYTVSAEL